MIARHVLSSFVRAARRCTREETRTFKLRSELISVEDKRNESERERTSRRETKILRANKGERNGHVAGVPRSTAHNARKRIERSIGEEGRKMI